jgi:hypothetical protein
MPTIISLVGNGVFMAISYSTANPGPEELFLRVSGGRLPREPEAKEAMPGEWIATRVGRHLLDSTKPCSTPQISGTSLLCMYWVALARSEPKLIANPILKEESAQIAFDYPGAIWRDRRRRGCITS